MSDTPLRFLRRAEVENMTGLGTTSIYKYMNLDQFPRTVEIAPHCVRWIESEVQDWMLEKARRSKPDQFGSPTQ